MSSKTIHYKFNHNKFKFFRGQIYALRLNFGSLFGFHLKNLLLLFRKGLFEENLYHMKTNVAIVATPIFINLTFLLFLFFSSEHAVRSGN